MTTPRGVKKINESIIQEGRALVITEEEASKLNWALIPDGSLKVNPNTGIMSVKLAGESDWVPGGVRNDGTICIVKDSKVTTETFKIINPDLGNGTFEYMNGAGEHRTKPLTVEGYPSFELEEGSYIPKRNNLQVAIDGVLHRSAETDDLTELDNHRFALKEKVVADTEIQATYVEKFKIGNPMPRIFVGASKPDTSDYADFWFDTNAVFDTNSIIEDSMNIEEISCTWNNVTGKPTTIAGYGIVDFAHRHNVSEIDGLNAMNGVAPHTHTKAQITDFSHTHSMNDITDLANHTHTTAQITGFAAHRHDVSTLDGLDAVISIPTGLITMWYGAVNTIPTGWALCNGQNGTPNLVDRFILGAGNNYTPGATGGETSHILTVGEMPTHNHPPSTGNSGYYQRGSGTVDEGGWFSHTGSPDTISPTTGDAGGGLAHNNMPPYIALCYIMKL